MPSPKTIENYPWKQYSALFEHVSTTRQALSVPCGGQPAAMSFRGQLYAFRRAIESNQIVAIKLGISPSAAMDCIITAKDGNLIISHREESVIAKLITEALTKAGGNAPVVGAPSNPDAAASLARLMSLVKGDGNAPS